MQVRQLTGLGMAVLQVVQEIKRIFDIQILLDGHLTHALLLRLHAYHTYATFLKADRLGRVEDRPRLLLDKTMLFV